MTEAEQRDIFSSNLRRLMTEQNKTQADMVRLFDISKSTASSWCVGAKMPRMGKVDSLAAWLGVRRSVLLEAPDNVTAKTVEPISTEELKFALFGDADDITDEDLADVKRYAEFVRARKRANNL